MKSLKFLSLLMLLTLVSCNKYTKDGCSKDKNGNEQWEKKDEFEEDEDDDEPVFYEIEDKLKERERLFQWDPVKVTPTKKTVMRKYKFLSRQM